MAAFASPDVSNYEKSGGPKVVQARGEKLHNYEQEARNNPRMESHGYDGTRPHLLVVECYL